jgi:hypothetical protein
MMNTLNSSFIIHHLSFILIKCSQPITYSEISLYALNFFKTEKQIKRNESLFQSSRRAVVLPAWGK